MGVCARRMGDEAAARLAASVAAYGLGAALEDIFSPTRGSADAAFARQVAMYLCHVAFNLSLARVAVAFGRDRTTVTHACHAVEDKREDERFDRWIGALEAMLQDPPAPGLRLVAP